ncbi:MAG: peroxidase-related enzyme [Candidatus Thermoplasmatota archaeon]
MATIRVIHEDEAEGKLFELYDEIQRNRGRVSNILRAQSLEPKAMRAHLDLYMATCFSKGGLSRREVELIAVAVSATNGDPYSLSHHKDALARYAKEPAWVESFAANPAKATTGREKALVEYAIQLTSAPQKGVAAQTAALQKAGLRDEEILQAAQVVGYYNFANRIAVGLGVELEPDGERDYHY